MSPLDQRQYINPDNYVNIMELIAEIATELDRSKVHLEEEIGRGECVEAAATRDNEPGHLAPIMYQIACANVLEPNQDKVCITSKLGK